MAKGRRNNGDGSIYQEKNTGKWIASRKWTDKSGEKHIKKFSSKKKSEVKNKLEEFNRELLLTGGDISKNDITFEKFADNWMTSTQKNKLKPTSYMRKDVTLRNQLYPIIGAIPMNLIDQDDVQNMVNELTDDELSFSTVKKAYDIVNECFTAYRVKTKKYINPCEGVALPERIKRDESNISFFRKDERKKIVEAATAKYSNGEYIYRSGPAIILMMYTGMRIGELIALTWDDIDYKGKTININKNTVLTRGNEKEDGSHEYKLLNQFGTKTYSGNRIIPLLENAAELLRELQKINGDCKYVISSRNNRQLSPQNIDRTFHRILKRAGITIQENSQIGVHSLRHTFASLMYENGKDTKVISDILGHSSTKITENIYIHLIQEQRVKAMQGIDK